MWEEIILKVSTDYEQHTKENGLSSDCDVIASFSDEWNWKYFFSVTGVFTAQAVHTPL